MTTDSTAPEGLKECPFCGGTAQLAAGGPGCYFVRCEGCTASTDDGSRERAIAAWNARIAHEAPQSGDTRTPAAPDVVERVARAIFEALAELNAKAAPLADEALPELVGNPTHRCKVCGAFWVKYPTHWSLFSKHAAPCCDNAAMGEQIEPVGDFRDALMIELAYARHVELPVSESTDRVISLLARGAAA